MASTDVLYDLAFPLMDLVRYGRQAEANALLNRYLGRTASDNLDALAALPLFLSLRAAIRAKVTAMREHADEKAALDYFALAGKLLLLDVADGPTLGLRFGMTGRLASQLPKPANVVQRHRYFARVVRPYAELVRRCNCEALLVADPSAAEPGNSYPIRCDRERRVVAGDKDLQCVDDDRWRLDLDQLARLVERDAARRSVRCVAPLIRENCLRPRLSAAQR